MVTDGTLMSPLFPNLSKPAFAPTKVEDENINLDQVMAELSLEPTQEVQETMFTNVIEHVMRELKVSEYV